MEDYSQLEHAGLLAVASGDVVPPPSGIDHIATSCDVPITIGGDTKITILKNVVYKYAPGKSKAQKLKSPTFVVFVPETPGP
jgi:hypothetical protein